MIKHHTECLICKSENLKEVLGYERHYLTKCQNCSFVFCSRVPTIDELDEHYKVYAYSEGQFMSDVTRKRYLEILEEMEPFRKTNKILDVGCGAGNFLEIAKTKGWEVHGTEFSKMAVKHCQEKGINIIEGVLDIENYNKESFDIITSFEVMEHINNPLEEVNKFLDLLRPHGLMYCTTPNFNALTRYLLKADYDIIQYPEHLGYFTKKTLNTLFENSGFKKHKLYTSGISLTRLQKNKEVATIDRTEENPDEKIRSLTENNILFRIAKTLANGIFRISNTGATLKAYYIKNR